MISASVRVIIFNIIVMPISLHSISECPTDIEPCQCEVGFSNLRLKCHDFENISQVQNALEKFPSVIDMLDIRHSSANLPSDIFQGFCIETLFLELPQLHISDSLFANQTECLAVLVIRGGIMEEFPINIFLPLKHLQTLAFAENHLSELKEPLWRLNVRFLILDNNNITRIHSGILPNTLKSLSLHHNTLQSLNNSLLNLYDLEWLLISYNNIKTLNDELTGLRNLELLYADGNQIETLDDSLYNCTKLKRLILSKNRISSLVDNFIGLDLSELDLSYNLLTELFDTEFQSLINLKTLDLSHNQIHSLGKSLTYLKNVQSLNLAGNQLTEIDESFNCLNKLKSLDLSGNLLENLDFFNIEQQPENCHFRDNNPLKNIDISKNPLQCTNNVSLVISSLILKNVEIKGNPC